MPINWHNIIHGSDFYGQSKNPPSHPTVPTIFTFISIPVCTAEYNLITMTPLVIAKRGGDTFVACVRDWWAGIPPRTGNSLAWRHYGGPALRHIGSCWPFLHSSVYTTTEWIYHCHRLRLCPNQTYWGWIYRNPCTMSLEDPFFVVKE